MMERPKDEELSWTEETYNYVDKLEFENNNLKKENEELKAELELEQIEKVDAQSKLIIEQTRNRFYSTALQKLGCDMEALSSEIHDYLTKTDK